jgi:hypothetical protein
MHNCAFCHNPLTPLTEWKASDGGFYCNEFCADAGEINAPSLATAREVAAGALGPEALDAEAIGAER